MSSNEKKRSVVWIVLLLIFLTWTPCLCIRSSPDNDFYNMASAGRWVAENGIMRTNPFFIVKGWQTVLQQWPYAFLLYKVYAWFGMLGVNLFIWVQAVGMTALGYLYMRLRHVHPNTALCCAVLYPICMLGYVNCRPEMLSNSLILMQLILLEQYAESRKLCWLLPVPLLFLLEANVHTTFWIFHVLFLLPYCFRFSKLPNRSVGWKAGLAVLVCSMPFVFLNVYGSRAVMILFHSGSVRKIGIGELTNMHGISLYTIEFMFGLYLFLRLWKHHLLSNVTAVLYPVCSVMFLAAQRCVIQFSLVLLLMMTELSSAPAIRAEKEAFWDRAEQKLNQKRRFYMFSAAFFACTGLALTGSVCSLAKQFTPDDKSYTPVQAADYLLEHEDPKTVRLFTDFNNGGYMTWRGFENIYIEPKTEPYLKSVNGHKDVLAEYCTLKHSVSETEICSILDQYDFDYFILSANSEQLLLYLDMSDAYEEVLVSYQDQNKQKIAYKLYRTIRNPA